MSLTLAQLIDATMQEIGMSALGVYVANGDPNSKTVLALANRAARTLSLEDWPELRTAKEQTLTTATEYDLPEDFRAVVHDTAWSDTQNRKIDLPTDNEFWAYLKSSGESSGIRYRARISGGKLQVHNPDSGDVIRYEYTSSHPVLDADGTTTKARFDADTDTFRLDDDLFIMCLKWMYEKRLGLGDWQVSLQEYQQYLSRQRVAARGAQTIDLQHDYNKPPFEPYTDLWV